MDQDDPSDGSRRIVTQAVSLKSYSPLLFGRWVRDGSGMDQDGSARSTPHKTLHFLYQGKVLRMDQDDPSDGPSNRSFRLGNTPRSYLGDGSGMDQDGSAHSRPRKTLHFLGTSCKDLVLTGH